MTATSLRFSIFRMTFDPNLADAYSYLAYLHFSFYLQIYPGAEDRLELASQLAARAGELDNTSAHALARLGYIQVWRRSYDEAIANSQRALALAPDNAEVHASFGQVLNYWGDPERGLEMLQKALNLEAFVSPVWEMQAGLSHWLLHQYDRAERRFLSTIARSPRYLHAYTYLACTYVERGQIDDARKAIRKALEIAPAYTVTKAYQIFPYRLDAVRDRLLKNLREAELPER
jgi:tetratricopeptide (TPR) repeat protein